MRITVLEQNISLERFDIFCKILLQLCMDKGLEKDLVKVLKTCGIKFEMVDEKQRFDNA